MPISIEKTPHPEGIQIVRTVIDTVDYCNASCGYCDNFNPNLHGNYLPAQTIEGVLRAADDQHQLDIVLSGGEITTHPEFTGVMQATRVLDFAGTTMITNGLSLTDEIIRSIRDSKISRVCISLDGITSQSHNYGRGNTFERALSGLEKLRQTGKNITVLTVLHPSNIDSIFDLSDYLARHSFADQHHFAAMYFSGRARENWRQFILPLERMKKFQQDLDANFEEFRRRGVYLVFNHYWPLTGQRPSAGNHRELLSHMLGEQNKATWAVVRSNGDVNQTTIYWGRQSAVDPIAGNLHRENAAILFRRVDDNYRKGELMQLPRDVEARVKYIVGDFDSVAAQAVVSGTLNEQGLQLVPCRPMSELDIMKQPIAEVYLDAIASHYRENPHRFRILKHATGVYLVYENQTGHVILLNETELTQLNNLVDIYRS